MNYSVADAIASVGGSTETDISAILPYGIAPGAKAVMRKERRAAEEVRVSACNHPVFFQKLQSNLALQ